MILHPPQPFLDALDPLSMTGGGSSQQHTKPLK